MCGVGDGPKVQATQQPALKRSSASGRPSYQRRLLQEVLLSLIWGITTGCLSYAPKGKLPAGVCLIIIGTEGNVMGTVRRVSRNVKYWRSPSMALRWAGAAMQEAAKGFRRLKAYKQLPLLQAALAVRKARATSSNAHLAQTTKAA